jgi:hypothetical protein
VLSSFDEKSLGSFRQNIAPQEVMEADATVGTPLSTAGVTWRKMMDSYQDLHGFA